MEVKDISETKADDNIAEKIDIDKDTIGASEASEASEANEAFEVTEAVETPTNEMCDVDEGDIRNKGNRKRKNCY